MSFLWLSKEKANYFYMRTIITDIVSKGLRTIFRQEWDKRYHATLGAWDDTPKSGQQFYNREKRRPRAKEHLPKYKSGNTNEWDCTAIFDAILYSNSIKKKGLKRNIRKEICNLRHQRNTILHVPRGRLPEKDFENALEKVLNSFLALGLDTQEISKIKSKKKPRSIKLYFLLFVLISIFTAFRFYYSAMNSENFILKVLPPQPIHEVVPRKENVSKIITDLHYLYSSNKGELTYFYISGNPGSGKSQLARQIGETYYNEMTKIHSGFTFVMTLNAKNLNTLLESYEDFARRLKCTDNVLTSIVSSAKTIEVKIRHLRTQIASRIKCYTSWLLIVDNVDNLQAVSPLLPQIRNEEWKGGQVLITTQDNSAIPPNSSFTSHISVSSGMGPTDSCNLLATLSGTGNHPKLGEVARQLDYQPLALAAAAVYVKQVRETNVSSEFSWNNYLQKLEEGKRQFTEEQLRAINPTYSLTMTTAVLLAVQKAAESDVILSHAFRFLSLVSFESLPLEVAINYVLLVDEAQDKEQVGVKIRKCSLIIPEDHEIVGIRLHRVVHDAIKIYVNKEDKEDNAASFEAAAVSFYQFKDRNDDRRLVPHLKTFYDAMTYTFPNYKELNRVKPRHETSKMFTHFGSILLDYGEFVVAKQYYERALDIDIKNFGSDHVDVATSYNNLGSVLRELGDLHQAKQHHERALEIRIKQLGTNHVDVATSYDNLGTVHQQLGNMQQARQYHERALEIRIKQLGSDHVYVATSYNNLGLVHQHLDDLKQAKRCHERALDIYIKQLGSNHVHVATSYNNLGLVHKDLGDLQQAQQFHERALDIYTTQLGSNHVDVATSYNNLGLVYHDLRDLQQAKQYYGRALEIYIKQLGSNNVNVATSYDNLGLVHQDLGDLQQAKQYLERALYIHIKQLGSDNTNVGTSYDNLGDVYQHLGDLQQAKRYHKLAQDIYVKHS